MLAALGQQTSPYSLEEGFLLTDPSHDLPNRPSRHIFNPRIRGECSAHAANASAIRKLFLNGPYSIRSYDPDGQHMLKILGVYVSASTSKRVKDNRKNIVGSIKEFSQDVIDAK